MLNMNIKKPNYFISCQKDLKRLKRYLIKIILFSVTKLKPTKKI